MANQTIYTVGGTIAAGQGLYITRRADQELLEMCRAGTFAYVLSSRQIGKSSLMVRTAHQLAEEGIVYVIIDLSQLGVQDITPEQWYLGLLTSIVEDLELPLDPVEWWQARTHLGITQRFALFFQQVLLAQVSERIAIFIDEIDSTLSLPFTDDFFAVIRSFYNARASEPDFQRLSFVLIGTATPSELMHDSRRTPFNIGQRVELTDFSFEEARPLAGGLGLPTATSLQVLNWVLNWTGGHPYLTQRLCREIARQDRREWAEADVDHLVKQIFFGERPDDNLQFVTKMLTDQSRVPDLPAVLSTYRAVRQGLYPVADDEQSLAISHLKLSGIVRREGHNLRVRNRIYERAFDPKWIEEAEVSTKFADPQELARLRALIKAKEAQAEAERQRAEAERRRAREQARAAAKLRSRSMMLTALFVVVIAALIILLITFAQFTQVNRARRNAELERQNADIARQTAETGATGVAIARETAYVGSIAQALARQTAQAGATGEARARQTAQAGEADAEAGATAISLARETAAAGATGEALIRQTAQAGATGEANARQTAAAGATQEAIAKSTAEAGQADARTAEARAENEQATAQAGSTQEAIAKETAEAAQGTAEAAASAEAEARAAEANKAATAEAAVKTATVALAEAKDNLEKAKANYYNLEVQKNIAEANARIAEANARVANWNRLIAQATNLRDTQYDLALLLSLEAQYLTETPETRATTFHLLNSNPQLMTFVRGHPGDIVSVALSPDGKMLATGGSDIVLWQMQAKTEGEPPVLKKKLSNSHSGTVTSLAFSPDSKVLASGDSGGQIKLWDVSDIDQPKSYPTRLNGIYLKHAEIITDLAFQTQGNILASSSLVSPDFYQEVETSVSEENGEGSYLQDSLCWLSEWLAGLFGLTCPASSLAINPAIILWDLDTGQPLDRQLPIDGGEGFNGVNRIAFKPDDDRILASIDDASNGVKIWDIRSYSQLTTFDDPDFKEEIDLSSLAFSKDGQSLVAGDEDGLISIWAIGKDPGKNGDRPVTQIHADGKVWALDFSQDNTFLISGSNKAELWPTGRQQSRQPLMGYVGPVSGLTFPPKDDSPLIVSLGQDRSAEADDGFGQVKVKNNLILFDVKAEQRLGVSLSIDIGAAYRLSFHPKADSNLLAVADVRKGTVLLWDVSRDELTQSPVPSSQPQRWTFSVAFNPEGTLLAYGYCTETEKKPDGNGQRCLKNQINLWDLKAQQEKVIRSDIHHIVRGLAFNPINGNMLAYGDCVGNVGAEDSKNICREVISLLNIETGETNQAPSDDEIISVAFNSTGARVAAGTRHGKIIVWAVRDNGNLEELSQLEHSSGLITSLAFNPQNDSELASSSQDGTIVLWDISETAGRPRIDLIGKPQEGQQDRPSVYSVAFSPDGNTLASAGADKMINLWHTENGERIVSLTGYDTEVGGVTFRSNDQLAAVSANDRIILWDVRYEHWQQAVCSIANRNLTQAEWNQYIKETEIPPTELDTDGDANSYRCTCPNLPAGFGAPPNAPGCRPE